MKFNIKASNEILDILKNHCLYHIVHISLQIIKLVFTITNLINIAKIICLIIFKSTGV